MRYGPFECQKSILQLTFRYARPDLVGDAVAQLVRFPNAIQGWDEAACFPQFLPNRTAVTEFREDGIQYGIGFHQATMGILLQHGLFPTREDSRTGSAAQPVFLPPGTDGYSCDDESGHDDNDSRQDFKGIHTRRVMMAFLWIFSPDSSFTFGEISRSWIFSATNSARRS